MFPKYHKFSFFVFLISLSFMLVLALFSMPNQVYAIDCFNEIDPIYLATDPRNEIHIHNDADIALIRNNIINYLWKAEGFPSKRPTRVIENIQSTPYLDTASMTNLARIDEVHIEMDLGFRSVVFMLHPVKSNNRLVIVHQGHGSRLNEGGVYEAIASFLETGFTVLAFHMPLVGPNTGPTVSHDNMVHYESDSVNPMKFFLEPIAVALNYVDDKYNFSDVTMVGLSGGGWTTHLYAAIDTRITASFPVAGSLPLYLREGVCGEDGDYEQGKPAHLIKLSPTVSFFYDQIASYLDLYLLASYGLGRTQIQILNQFDSCCFWGIRYITYETIVKDALARLGFGTFRVALDTSHFDHRISVWALNQVILRAVAISSGKALIRGVHAQSLVPESPVYSLGLGYGAVNLVDGDPGSLAYPGSVHLDYVIQLNGLYQASGISIDWNGFGTQAQYVNSWQVLGRNGNQPWQPLAKGGFPGVPTLDIPLNATVTEVRIIADGSNWLGIYEARVFGTAFAPSLPSTVLGVHSNVPEDPLYSIARHYQASNLVDGDPTTLAYPGSTALDYTITLPGLVRVSSVRLTWGVFGTNPLYIQSWSLMGRYGASQPWVTLVQGGFPNSPVTGLSLDFLATDLRVVASAWNWIGIYDLQINDPYDLLDQ